MHKCMQLPRNAFWHVYDCVTVSIFVDPESSSSLLCIGCAIAWREQAIKNKKRAETCHIEIIYNTQKIGMEQFNFGRSIITLSRDMRFVWVVIVVAGVENIHIRTRRVLCRDDWKIRRQCIAFVEFYSVGFV